MKQSSPPANQAYYLNSRMQFLRENFIHPPFDYEHELLEAIRYGDESRAMDMLRKINELEAAVLATYPLRSKKNALIASCTLFTRAIIKGGVDAESAFHLSDTLINEIEKIGDVERLIHFEYEMLVQFVSMIRREREELSYSHIVNLAVFYIREHIFEELTLQRVAEYLKVHPSYLSDRFKRETGVCITTFINRRKIEESKHLLINTNQPISEIAFTFKFCSQSYYTQLFKNFTGVTPRKFRMTRGT
ncbi:helix-turn-helix domain-containing protein [Paenibacillus dakarensis]|uniref:helix-turn-helix domain-containing protein n=1 Tax=Paenibacillus dakarensis TaxID=1527293 RepID=UPI0006D5480D|nr:AraC family transcriptional regulator [Paenibacillus dakarensis]